MLLDLGRRRETQSSKRVTSDVQAYSAPELDTECRDGAHAHFVVQEGAEFRRSCSCVRAANTLCVQAYVKCTASREHDDAVEVVVGADQSPERLRPVILEPRIRRRLPATHCAFGDDDVEPQALEDAKRRDRDPGM